MEIELINGKCVEISGPDTQNQDILPSGAIPANLQDMNASQIQNLVAALITSLDQVIAKNDQLMNQEKQMEEALSGFTSNPLEAKVMQALEKQIEALIDRQKSMEQDLKELEGMAANIAATGCKITSTSNPIEALTQQSSETLKKNEELCKEAKDLLNEIAKVLATLNNLKNTPVGQLENEGDKMDQKMDQTLQAHLKTIENDVKKLTQAIQHHLLTHPPEPSQNTPSPASHNTIK